MFSNRKKLLFSDGAAGSAGWRRLGSAPRLRRATREPLSLRETIRRASLYCFGISALWGVAYLFFLLSGDRWI